MLRARQASINLVPKDGNDNVNLSGPVTIGGLLTLNNSMAMASAAPIVTFGDATGSGGQYVWRKATASQLIWREVRAGGTASGNRQWVETVEATSNNYQFARYAAGVQAGIPISVVGADGGISLGETNGKVAFFQKAPVSKQATTGTTAGFTAGVGATVLVDSTFTGNTGSTAYTVGDVVLALKNYGMLAA